MKTFLKYFWQHGTIGLLLVSMTLTPMLFTTGCTTAQKLAVVQDVQKFIPVITNVADAVCGFEPSNGICTGAVASVSASATVLATALTNYYTAQSSGTVPAGIIAALNQAITTFEANASQILDAVHVLNPQLQTEIIALVTAAQVLLAVIESLLPTTSVTLRFTSVQKPANFSLNSFAGDYNTKVKLAQKYMPRNVNLKMVHVHSIFLRVFPGVH